MHKRPNFLFFIADQLRADSLSCYGNNLVRTPHIESIARRGVRFDRCYVASPVCQPNRSTIMTGRMPSVHGTHQNGIPLSLDAVCFTHILREAQYRTALFGKAHFQNFTGSPPRLQPSWPQGLMLPSEELRDGQRPRRVGPEYDRELMFDLSEDPSVDEVSGSFYGFDRFRVCTWHGDGVRGHYSHWLREKLGGKADPRTDVPPQHAAGRPAPQVYASTVPEQLHPTNYVADETIAYLEEHAANSRGQPFFVKCSFPDPHHPFSPPPRFLEMYDPDSVTLPDSFYKRPKHPPALLARLHDALAKGERNLDDWVTPYAVTESEAKITIAATWGMVSFIDEAVGRVMAKLNDLGMADDTVVVFTSDHGDWMADHGLMLKGPLHYQGLIRVPLIWMEPQSSESAVIPNRSTRELVSSLDLARSFLERAGMAAPHGMQGQNLTQCMHEGGQSEHDCVIIEHQTSRPLPNTTRPIRVRTMTDGKWRISIWEGQNHGELYDLMADPDELVDLWCDPDSRHVRAQLVERMLRKTIELQERSPLPVAEA